VALVVGDARPGEHELLGPRPPAQPSSRRPGERRNLTPITKKCTSQHHALVESLCKTASEKGWHIDYWVDVLYDAAGPTLKATPNNPDPAVWPHLATHVQCQFQVREPENGAITGGGAKKLFIENTHDN
jgi:hypothetical protein